jgi:mevalonyl-CoA ligase
MIFMAPEVGSRSMEGHLRMILDAAQGELPVRMLVLLEDILPRKTGDNLKCQTYVEYMGSIEAGFVSDTVLGRAESRVAPSDIVNFSFTSGMYFCHTGAEEEWQPGMLTLEKRDD